MKNLKSIHLKNFQSHKNTLITFAKQGALTVITGPSDSGKSAVIRALRWVFYNVPQGYGFIFNAEDKCSVLLTYDDGTTVERIRSRGGVNRYVVNGQVYEGFGTGVPLEVRQASGIRKLEIGDQSFLLNLSEQLDGPFLGKSVSGPARAKVLGKLAGTEEIDYAGKEIGTDIYRAKKQKELYERDIEGLDKQIARYDFVFKWEKATAQAEKILWSTKEKIAQIIELKKLASQWQEIGSRVRILKKVIDGLKDVDVGLGLIETVQNDLARGNALAVLKGKHLRAFLETEKAKGTINLLNGILEKASPLIETIAKDCGDLTGYVTKDREFRRLRESLLVLRSVVNDLADVEEAESSLLWAVRRIPQLDEIKRLECLHEKTSHCVLAFRRFVQNLLEIDRGITLLSEIMPAQKLKESAGSLYRQHNDLMQSRQSQGDVVNSLRGIEKAESYLAQAVDKQIQYAKVRESVKLKSSLEQKVTYFKESLGRLSKECGTAEDEYLRFMESVGKCPTCGQAINVNKLREVM